MRIWVIGAICVMMSAGSALAEDEVGSAPPKRIRSVAVTPGDKCPPANGNEVVVCYTQDDPYRIPKQFRQLKPSAANQSWVNRAATMDEVSRVAGGLPDTCSPVGTGGQSGCTAAMFRAWAADRRQMKRDAEAIP